MKKLEWKTVKRKVKDLVPFKKNPRKITPERQEKLKASLEKFNLAEIPIVNFDNTLIGGNQRVKILQMVGRGNETIDVRYPNRKLSEQEVKEYALTSNSHAGEWDMDVLDLEFGDFDLSEFDIDVPGEEQERPERSAGNAEKKWFVYIDCVTEKEAEKMYSELSGRGFETKVVN